MHHPGRHPWRPACGQVESSGAASRQSRADKLQSLPAKTRRHYLLRRGRPKRDAARQATGLQGSAGRSSAAWSSSADALVGRSPEQIWANPELSLACTQASQRIAPGRSRFQAIICIARRIAIIETIPGISRREKKPDRETKPISPLESPKDDANELPVLIWVAGRRYHR